MLVGRCGLCNKFLIGYPLPSKEALEVIKKLMALMLTFCVRVSIRCDTGGEFTATVVHHFCKWLDVTLDRDPADFSRSQGAAERMEGWFQEVLSILHSMPILAPQMGSLCPPRLLD